MYSAKDLRGRAVVDVDAGRKLGQVDELLLDFDGRKVAGLIVASGQSLEEGASVWTSPDGTTWSYVSKDPVFVGQGGPDSGVGGTGGAGHDGRIVIVGWAAVGDDSMAPFAWRSDPGGKWSRVALTGFRDGDWELPGVTTTGDGFLGYGWSEGCPGGIWSSVDGTAWQCDANVPAMTGFAPIVVGTSDKIDVALGTTKDGAGAIWYRTR